MPNRLSALVRSLRFRLMLWNAGAVLVTGFAILIAVREGVRYTLIYELDQVLREDIQEIRLHFESAERNDWQRLHEELNRKAVGHNFHDWFVTFYNAQGRPVWSSVGAPTLPEPTPNQQRVGAFSLNNYRLSFARLPSDVEQAAVLAVGCSEQFISRDMARIDRLVGLVAFAVLISAPLAGHFITSRTIRPLANMIRTTARLRPGELHERLPIRGTGDELDRLSQTINGMLDRIGVYLAQEHDFVANAAHELRTPLAAIRSSVEVALGSDRSREEYCELLGIVIEQCASLQSLVNQLLLLAETDANRLKADGEPVLLDEIVTSAADMFEGVADLHGIRLHLDVMPSVKVVGNRYHLRQVINNLLDNAIKFTAQKKASAIAGNGKVGAIGASEIDGDVLIELFKDEPNRLAVLKIGDNGVGIPVSDVPHIFERFYRVDKSRMRAGVAGGTGLGLSICKAIVEAHHGEIVVASEAGKGTTVTITLPLQESVRAH